LSISERNGGSVVDQNVDSAEFADSSGDSLIDRFLVADVDNHRKSATSSGFDFFRGAVNRSWQFWMRLGSFCGDNDVCAEK
jgi:hypothetical protein